MEARGARTVSAGFKTDDLRRLRIERDVRRILRLQPELMLVGSWATGEAHLPAAACGIIPSQSDIDLVAITPCSEVFAADVAARILAALADAKVAVTKISIRSADELAHAPHGCEWGFGCTAPHGLEDPERFLKFWSMVSATEGCIRIASGALPHSVLVSYSISKYFFTLARNLAIIEGQAMHSYRSIFDWVKRIDRDVPAAAAYAMKLGMINELPCQLAARLVGGRGFPLVVRERLGEAFDAVVWTGDCFVDALETGRVVEAAPYLATAWSLAADERLRRIVHYEESKWRQAREFRR